MKFAVSSSELLHGLLSVSRVIANKPSQTILENYLFELKGNTLTVTAADGETTLRTSIQIENVMEEGEVAIPAKLLTDSLKEFPDQPLVFSIGKGDTVMDITWSTGASKIPCQNAKDFPELPTISEISESVTIPAESLLNGINGTIYATADDEIRPVMNGIFFDIDVDSTTLVASDAHKLICYTFKDAKPSQKSAFILHKKPAALLKAILSKNVESVSIRFDNKNAYFSFDNTLLISRLIEGTYPAYKTVLPKNNPNKLTIARLDLLNVVKRVAVCSNQATNQIKLKISQNELIVSAQDLGFNISAYEKASCQYEGDEMEIGFKAQFLIEILSNLPYQDICMELSSPVRAALIVPGAGSTSDDELCALIMPIMVQ